MAEQAIHILSGTDVQNAVSMPEAIALMRSAFEALSTGKAVAPLRRHLDIPEHNATALFMPASFPAQNRLALKAVTVYPGNAAAGLPTIHALVMVFDAATGRPLAMMDGEYLTALRTGAASGLATDLLAPSDASVVAIFGTGVQARTQLAGVCAVRPIRRALVVGRSPERAERFCREMEVTFHFPVEMAGPAEALEQAQVVCTATTATEPVFSPEMVSAGTHINAVGSYKPHVREIPGETVAAATVFVDQREACLTEAGDLVIPLKQGLITEDHVVAELGEVVAGKIPGRRSPEEITLFKSVGNAVQDLVVASRALENAQTGDYGTIVFL